ncbi:cell wall-binding repeat-containing protein [Herbiconiux sp. CPCC 205716]|uniref:Cell wall-binding repeat-containing protein n=1 Tax=Herbiconiux gentiana TaxID=2970912 RepID=A0ABT2GCS9_9MICO|nr:cell wall-binding repeat-containing protein [Herbiconiux gentiana]MCS5714026.1 cell wall-binding repeat-containing protein [Herbiconiux gentiana]
MTSSIGGAARRRHGLTWVCVAALALVAVSSASPVAAAEEPPADGGAAELGTKEEAEALAAISVTRMAAADRFELGAAVALATRPSGADVVYVASGANFPDALSAGPAAVQQGGALLLTAPDAAPPSVLAALTRLNPRSVIVVGGESAVSSAVLGQLAAAAPRAVVGRLSGADRYAVSRAIAGQAFPAGADNVFVATGANFPDALSAVSPAAILASPVLLVNGSAAVADSDTQRAIAAVAPGSLVVMGGTLSVSAGVYDTLSPSVATVRIGGVDRFAVSAAVNEHFLADFSTVYFATGATFPDALVGGVLTGTRHNPLYIVPPGCVPAPVLSRLARSGTSQVVLLGGSASLSPAVEALTPCP